MSMTPSSVLAMLADNGSDFSLKNEKMSNDSGDLLYFAPDNQYGALGEEISGSVFFRMSKPIPGNIRISLKFSGDLVLKVVRQNQKAGQFIMRVPQNSPRNGENESRMSEKQSELSHHSIVIPVFSQSVVIFTFRRKIRTNILHIIPVVLKVKRDIRPSSYTNLMGSYTKQKNFSVGPDLELVSVALKHSISLGLFKKDSVVELETSVPSHIYIVGNRPVTYPVLSRARNIKLDHFFTNEKPFSIKNFFQECCIPTAHSHPIFKELGSVGFVHRAAIRFEKLSETKSQIVIVFPSWDIELPKSACFELFMHLRLKNNISTVKVLDFPIKIIEKRPFVFNYVLSQTSEVKLPPIDHPDFSITYESTIKLVSSKGTEYTILKDSPSDILPLLESDCLNSKSEYEFSSSFSQSSFFNNEHPDFISLPSAYLDLNTVPAFEMTK